MVGQAHGAEGVCLPTPQLREGAAVIAGVAGVSDTAPVHRCDAVHLPHAVSGPRHLRLITAAVQAHHRGLGRAGCCGEGQVNRNIEVGCRPKTGEMSFIFRGV